MARCNNQDLLSRVDKEVDRKLIEDLRRHAPPPADDVRGSNDGDLMGSMMRRLAAVESELKASRREHQQKDELIVQLRQERRRDDSRAANVPRDQALSSEQASTSDVTQLVEELDRSRGEASRLRRQLEYAWGQVGEIKEFLNDYGLVWIGDSDREGQAGPGGGPAGPQHSEKRLPQPAPSSSPTFAQPKKRASLASLTNDLESEWNMPGTATSAQAAAQAVLGQPQLPLKQDKDVPAQGTNMSAGMTIDIKLLQERVDELNAVAGDGKAQVVAGRAGEMKLRMPDALPLVVYRDGIQLRNSPFRPFTDGPTKSLMNDILDGYFPYELKDEFPEGVPFKVVDRSRSDYAAAHSAGPGPAKGNIHSLTSLDTDQHGAPMSKAQYLSNLPKSVIRNGKVIEVRSEIEALLQGKEPGKQDSDHALIETPMSAFMSAPGQGSARSSKDGPPIEKPEKPEKSLLPGVPTTMLRIKREDGQQTYAIKLPADNTLGDLRTYLDKHRATTHQYEIRSAFPNKLYEDDSETLLSAGLVPNAALYLKAV